jgi:hypothetical protein
MSIFQTEIYNNNLESKESITQKKENGEGIARRSMESIAGARENHGTKSKKETPCLGTQQAYLALPTLPRGNLW